MDKRDNIRKELTKTGVLSLIGKLTAMVATFVATPFTVRLLGPSLFGLWALVQSILTYLTLADIGMANASTKFAGEYFAQNDSDSEISVIWTSCFITGFLTIVSSLTLVLVAPFLLTHVLHVPQKMLGSATWSVRIAAIAVIARSLSYSINTPQTIRLRWGWLTIANYGTAIVGTILSPIALKFTSGGVVAMAAVTVITAVMSLAINYFAAIKVQPLIIKIQIRKVLIPRLLRYGGALAITGFVDIPLATAERLFLAHYHSLTIVAYYSLSMSLAAIFVSIPAVMLGGLFSTFVRLNTNGSSEELHRIFKQFIQGIFLFVAPAIILFMFLASPFLRLWVGQQYAFNCALPLFILLPGFSLNLLAIVPYNYLLAVGRTSTIAKIHLAELLPYLILALIFTEKLGAVGAAIVWSCRATVHSAIFFVLTSKKGLPWFPLPTRAIIKLISLFGLTATTLILSTLINSLAIRALFTGVLVLCYIVITWKVTLKPFERNGIKKFLIETFPFLS